MITKVIIKNFKKYDCQDFALDDAVVLAGPNNSGKSTLLQALATWAFALDRWRLGKGKAGVTVRTGQAITRKDFTALPLRLFDMLWYKRLTGLSKAELGPGQKFGEPRLIHITVEGSSGLTRDNPWSLTMELRYQSTEQIYVKPVLSDGETVPREATDVLLVHCPPFSGIGAEERRMDRGAQQLEIGRGKPGDILRNLLHEVSKDDAHWEQLTADIRDLFQISLVKPEYDEAMPFIVCEYLAGVTSGKSKKNAERYDIASGGSGFHQVLLLLSFFYARPASVLLMDEPDAHLHVILQKQVYERLRSVASKRQCQLIVATHSEVILDSTAPTRVISFLGTPHRLVHEKQRDQLREAMGRLSTLDLLLSEQGRAVLYCEGQSDFDILRVWARTLKHPAQKFLNEPFFHANGGRSPGEARAHLFALRAVHPDIRGLLILDGDNRANTAHEMEADGLTIQKWKRYEIENYLLVPEAIRRFFSPSPQDMFTSHDANTALEYLKTQLPPAVFVKPLSDETAAVVEIPASKKLLPQMFDLTKRKLEKNDYYLIAELMTEEEIHADIRSILDAIAALVSPRESQE